MYTDNISICINEFVYIIILIITVKNAFENFFFN